VRFALCLPVAIALAPLVARAQEAAVDGGAGTDAGTTADAGADTVREAPSVEIDAGGLADADISPPAGPSPYDVVVVGRKPTAKDRTQDATRVDGQRLRDNARASTFEDLAQEDADVYVSSRGAGIHGIGNMATGGIRIRGLGGSPNSQILVVEDDAPDYQGIFGHPIPDAYVPALIDEVLVIKGGDSTLYGTNAMGGVVVIRNRWRGEDGYELVSDAALGSYQTARASVSALGRVGNWDMAAALSDLTTDGQRPGAGGSDTVASTALRYRLTPTLRISVRNKVTHVDGNDPGPVTTPTPDHWFDAWRDNASAQLVYTQDGTRLTITPYLNTGIHRLYDGFYSHDYVAGSTAELDLRLHQASLLFGLASEGVAGSVENRITGDRPDVRDHIDGSLYSQLTLRPIAGADIVLGARELYSSRYGSVPLYKAGTRLDLGRGFSLHSRVSRNFRQPTMSELYLPYPVANPDLKPEYALNSDLGAAFLSEHLEISGTGYRTEARNLIKYFGQWPAAEVINIDHIVIWGVEGRIAVKKIGPLSLMVAGDRQTVGRYTRQNPNGKVNFTVEAVRTTGAHFLRGTLTGEWVHGLYMADYGRQPMSDVFVMDLALRDRYTSVERRLTIEPYLLLRNFLDRRYAYVQNYPMPGFNVLAGLKVGI
jgi:outer membrane cobalamin receptor